MKTQIIRFEDFSLEALSSKEMEEVNGGGTFAHWIGDVLQWFSENSPEHQLGDVVWA
jgi:hypothetical protein